jgi:dTDP-4-dehydrorhamnose reductase
MARAEGIAVTGRGGRLGRALLDVPGRALLAWGRPDFDLDRPASFASLLDRDRPGLVIHAAAMTDVDDCARHPELALRRNGEAVGVLAEACRARGAGLVLISTNEVFDGERTDGRGYAEGDAPRPRNPYGASKLAGEEAARSSFDGRPGLWIVRTAWLFGPPGRDFPDKVVAAADRLPAGQALPVVADEVGSPTYTRDLAAAILRLVEGSPGGVFHLVNEGRASRLEWAARVLARERPGRPVRAISRNEFERASDPPAWAVLDASLAAGVTGRSLRPWQEAVDASLGLGTGAGTGQVWFS